MNVVALALAVWCAADDQLRPPQVRIDVAVYRGDPLGSVAKGTIKSLAEPSLVPLNGQKAIFLAGVTQPVSTGIQLAFTATVRPDGTAKLERKFAISRRVPATGGVQTKECEANEVVKLGETVRVRLTADAPDSQTWVEFSVRRESRGP